MMDRESRHSTSEEEHAMGSTSDDKIKIHRDDMEHEMNLHVEKKEKYKKLYNEEKERNRELQLEMAKQLKEKDSEILRLRKRIKDIPLDWDYKLQSLEKCVAEKEDTIEMLTQKLRKCIKEKKKCVAEKEAEIETLKQQLKDIAKEKTNYHPTASSQDDPQPVLPMANNLAFKATIRNHGHSTLDVDNAADHMELLNPTNLKHVKSSAHPVHKDRFLDAPGEPMKLCPVCNKSFPMDVADLDFENHVMDHVEGICPICRMCKGENMTDDDFMRHVNKHYEDSDEN